MTTDIPPTRSALLELQDKRSLAEKGHSLLEKKRDALIHEFFDHIDEYKDLKERVYSRLSEAYDDLHLAQGINGVDTVRSLGHSQPPTMEITTGDKSIMGVTVPDITVERNDLEDNASVLDIDTTLDHVRQAFQDLVDDLVRLNEKETTIRRLAEAIKRTKRRVNSLEHIQIPEMRKAEERVEQHLLEQERQSFVRLKQLK